VEYYDDIFEAIKYATDKGIIVIESAGNGGLNLDQKLFEDAFNRSNRDSGALLIGAGGTPAKTNNLKKLPFSNYGSRLDFQAWGEDVVTTGYGNLHSGHNTKYTNSFDGTSSAAGIMAGICAAIQGYAKANLGRVLTIDEMIQVLTEGAEQQDGNTKRRIGPRPNLESAFDAVDDLLSVSEDN
jgi:hypothetical protein